ncbi:MAG TPA: glycerol kinase GlpK [Acidimicrobiales bacterium]|nr:glycerol kinase GlpK [Acidimicrobiales bacterium]
MRVLLAVDAGTTGVRALAVDAVGRVIDVAYRDLTQSYPVPGWVEHDPDEILRLVDETLEELAARLDDGDHDVVAIGITNQRETTVAIDRSDGRPMAPAIVWQDRRTAPRCASLAEAGDDALIRARTGLTADPYFSATKMQWLLEHAPLDGARELGLCTVDTLVGWHLTGGANGGAYVTDASNASRTMLYDLGEAAWSPALCALFSVPTDALAMIVPSCGVIGTVAAKVAPLLAGVPVAGILGDQQAALFGQRCTSPGMVKATFGTGAFLLVNAGHARPPSVDGLVTTVAWDLGELGERSFALEASAFVAGAAIQWLRDELGLIVAADQVGVLAASVTDTNGATFVPAFTGLGSPWWDPAARGTLMGLSRGVTKAHVARAVVESLGFLGRAMLDAMRLGGIELTELRVDGGAVAMDLLCQLLADGAALRVRRPASVEATAIGAAMIAGVAVNELTLAGLEDSWEQDASFAPREDHAGDAAYATWLDAVSRVRALGERTPPVTHQATSQ